MLELTDLQAAELAIRGAVHRTPVMTSRTLNDAAGAEVFLKCESMQRTGSFKFRGAYHFIRSMTPGERNNGVCTVSAGNHAQAVALAARELGSAASILMPEDAPRAKFAAVANYGGRISTYNRFQVSQVEAGRAFAQEQGTTFVPAYDHHAVMAGAGTAALELIDEVGALDTIVCPVGGGGLIAGTAVAAKAANPACVVVGVDPDRSPLAQQSLQHGRLVELSPAQHLADGQMLSRLGQKPFEVMRHHVNTVVTVTDNQILGAMTFLLDRLKLVTEPSGAVATAAVLAGHIPAGGRIGVLVSGGNVGHRRLADLLTLSPMDAGARAL